MSGLFSSAPLAADETAAGTIAGPPPGVAREKTPASAKIALCIVLAIAIAPRVWNVLTNTYVIFADETFQYLEQAHRLAFGSGVIPWEYIDGIRSWLLPGALALLMRLAALASHAAGVRDDPNFYVTAIRFVLAAFSLTVPFVGFSLARRRLGLAVGVATGLLCALWFELIYYAPTALAEVLATHVAFWAIWLGDVPPDTRPIAAPRISPRRIAASGALYGLACVLRYQYAPALVAAAVWQSYSQHGRDRMRWLPLAAGAVAVFALGSGLLDWITWGSPFQSVWWNFRFNAVQGVAAALSTEPWFFLPDYFVAAWGPAAFLLAILAAFGAMEAPALAAAALATIVLHSLTPHKEVRFIYLALAAVPVLLGLGLGRIVTWQRPSRAGVWVLALAMAPLIAVYEGLWADTHAVPADALSHRRSIVRAFEAAGATPDICGLGVRSLQVFGTGGYTYLHAPVPILFETADEAMRQVTPTFQLKLKVIAAGREVEQYSPAGFAEHSRDYNLMIGEPGDALPGFERGACFGAGTDIDARYCVFRRPGDCAR